MEKEKPILNRLKLVMAIKNKTNKQMAKDLHVCIGSINNWRGNRTQPTLYLLFEIAQYLDVDPRDLLQPVKETHFVFTATGTATTSLLSQRCSLFYTII